jgi:tetratricopeptide (TPR) repeat protein
MRASLSLLLLLALVGCSARSYTHYLIEPAPKKNPALLEEGTLLRPFGFGSTTVMKVTWNDGQVLTEVQIPLLASGQRIIIEHGETPEGVKTLPATRLVPPKPTVADATLVEAYAARGLRVNDDAPDISLTRTQTLMEDALRAGNYQLALEWCEMVLARYPSHPRFMRAKGSILMLMGERQKAIEVYEAAEEIESDPQVRQVLEKLRKAEAGGGGL